MESNNKQPVTNLKALCAAKGIRFKDLAHDIGVSRVSVSRISLGLGKPSLDVIEALCSRLECDASEIFPKLRGHA